MGSIITTFGVSVSIFLVGMLLLKKSKSPADHYLMSWFALVGLHLIYFSLGFSNELNSKHLLIAFGSAAPVLHIILIFLYLQTLRYGFMAKQLAKSGTLFIGYVIAFYFLSTSGYVEPDGIRIEYVKGAPTWGYFLSPSFIIVYVYYAIQIFPLISQHQLGLKTLYSDQGLTSVDWLYIWIVSYLIVSVLIIAVVLISDLGFLSVNNAFHLVALLLSFQLFLVGQFGAKSNFTFPEAHIDQKPKYESSGLKPDKMEPLKERLETYMREAKPYLNNDLTLNDLSKAMDLPTYQVSQIINEGFQKTFFDLVNEHRVEEAIDKIGREEYAHLSLLGIAFECGFNSKSGFYKVFKKATGVSPSAYKQGKRSPHR